MWSHRMAMILYSIASVWLELYFCGSQIVSAACVLRHRMGKWNWCGLRVARASPGGVGGLVPRLALLRDGVDHREVGPSRRALGPLKMCLSKGFWCVYWNPEDFFSFFFCFYKNTLDIILYIRFYFSFLILLNKYPEDSDLLLLRTQASE